MSLPALSQNRHSKNYLCEVYCRPIITSVESSAVTSTSTTVISTTAGNLSGDTLDVTTITAENGTITTLTSNTMNTLTLVTTFISSFSVASGNDVRFIGANTSEDFFWDSSRSTLYVEKFKTNDCFIYLSVDKNETVLDGSSAGQYKGVVYQWFDNVVETENKFGFFGLNPTTERFFNSPNVTITESTCEIEPTSGVYGDMEARDIYVRNIVNENISDNLGITSIADINIQSENDMTITTDNLIATINDGYTLGITNDHTIDIIDGLYDLYLNSSNVSDSLTLENTNGSINILSNSTNSEAIYIHSQNSNLKIEASGSGDDIELNAANEIIFNTDTGVIASLGITGFISNKPKQDYLYWINFHDFNVSGNSIWTSMRNLISLSPIHSWQKEAASETAIIYSDINLSSRTTSSKGYKLIEIFFAYEITTQDINSITPLLTLKSYDSNTPSGGVALSDIAFTDVNLAVNVGEHYRSITIDSPFFINNESILNIELSINTQSNSVFYFQGCNLSFQRNDT